MDSADQRTSLREAIAIVVYHGLDVVEPSHGVSESRTFEQGAYAKEYVAELDVAGDDDVVIQCVSQSSMDKAKALRDQLMKKL